MPTLRGTAGFSTSSSRYSTSSSFYVSSFYKSSYGTTSSYAYPFCGDGKLEPNREECDLGGLNGQLNSGCSVTCQITKLPYCGDSVVQAGEECDDGNTRDSDGCTSLCKTEKEYCPDGKVCGSGKCSDGSVCIEAYCGDGKTQSALSEQCDDGNRNLDDDCDNDCRWIALPECGDGIVQEAYEICDDGDANSMNPNAVCRLNCVPQRCGDGILDDFVEECDDGNNVNGDGCTSVCTLPERAAPQGPGIIGSLLPPTQTVPSSASSSRESLSQNIPTPARTPTGPGLVIFLASGAAAGIGVMRKRFIARP
jgi:cysteine-rich repeat protein